MHWQPEPGHDFLYLDVPESRVAEGLFQYLRLAEAEGAGLTGQRWRQCGLAADDRYRYREKAVALGSRVDHGSHPAAVTQFVVHAAQCLLLVREVDQADPRDDYIEGARIQLIQALAVDGMGADIVQPGQAWGTLGVFQDGW